MYGTIQLDGREGVVYERIEGVTLLNETAKKPWTAIKVARLLATLHSQVHKVKAQQNIQIQREWATGGIPESKKLPPAIREEILKLLNSLPQGEQLCHGDFHPGNIIHTKRGPIIIDWMTASRGSAAGDVARTSIILEAAKPPPGTPLRWLLEWIRGMFQSSYQNTYFRLNPIDMRLFFAWRTVMAANFFDVSLPEEESNLFQIIEQGLRSWKSN